MLFHLDDVDRIGTLGALLVEELVQFRDVHGLYQVVDFAQFGHFEVDECIEVAELLEFLDAQRVEFALGVARCRPAFGLGVEFHVGSFERAGHRAAVILLQREERRLLRTVVVAADVGERPRLDLPVDVAVELGVLLAFYVLRLEIDDVPLRNGYQPEVQRQRKAADDQRPEEIGPHQAAERHAAREHGDDLGLVGHFRGEEDTGDEGNPDNAQSGEPEDDKAKVTTLTEDDVDRIVQKRLARARKKWDKDHTEAERLKKMTDDEKKQYEEDKRKEDLDNREAAITRRELTAVAKEQLNAAGVPADMADFIDYTDADSVNESVKRLSKAFKGAVQQSVDDRLKGKAPLDKAKNNVLTAEEENARKAFANALKF